MRVCEVSVFAAHGLFTTPVATLIADPAIARIVVSDSVPPFRLPADAAVRAKLRVVSAVPLFAQAIGDCHGSWQD